MAIMPNYSSSMQTGSYREKPETVYDLTRRPACQHVVVEVSYIFNHSSQATRASIKTADKAR